MKTFRHPHIWAVGEKARVISSNPNYDISSKGSEGLVEEVQSRNGETHVFIDFYKLTGEPSSIGKWWIKEGDIEPI